MDSHREKNKSPCFHRGFLISVNRKKLKNNYRFLEAFFLVAFFLVAFFAAFFFAICSSSRVDLKGPMVIVMVELTQPYLT